MTDVARPIFVPLTTVTGEVIDTARSGLVTLSPILEAGVAAANPVRLAQILEDLAADAALTLSARSHDDFCNAMRAWGDDLVELAAVVLTPVAAAGVVAGELVEALAIELLRWKFPRLASMLSLAGAIVEDPGLGSRIDWEALREFMLVTPDLVDETFWDDLFGAADMDVTGRMPALLAALLIVAPEVLTALNAGELSIAPLLPPPTPADASTQWKDLRANSTGWVPITFPLRTEGGRLRISEFPDLRGGFDPELAISLLIRSQRRPSGGRTVTDFEMWLHPSTEAAFHELRTSAGFVTRLEPGVRVGAGYDGGAGTWNAAVEPRPGSAIATTTNEATLQIRRDTAEGVPDLLFGPPYDTRVVARDISLEVRLRELGEPSVEIVGLVEGFGLVLTNRWFRSLGESESSLREGLRFDVDLEARLTEGAGFSFAAEGGLTTRLQVDKGFSLKVLKVKVHSILFHVPIRADQDHFDIRGEVRPHWSATVGPVTLVMDGAGGWVGWWADEPGGPKHCIGLLPPTGAGLLLELPGVSGGGFVDFTGGPNDRYGGVLTLTVGPPKGLSRWTVTAFGIHELTGSPTDTDRDRTFVLVIGASFRPGVHLAYGIFWIGAGGIIGINRRADTDALRERLTSGAVGNILFAEDPVRNAPVLLGDLAALFPPRSESYVFGLTMQLGWIPLKEDYLVRLAVGVIIEFDRDKRPTKVILLGSLRLNNPELERVLDVQVDVVGVFDPVRHTLEVDATIRRGLVMGLFKLTGDGGLRSSWGDTPYMMATLGGFHPDFHPEPAVFPKLKRILLTVDEDRLPDAVELSASGYMAVTSNTIQFGAEFTAAIKAGNWKIEGKIGGDALIRLPFYFDVTLKGGVHVKYRGHNLFGVKFKGGLSGPSPLVLRGEVCVSLLFFDACWSDSFELGHPGAIPGAAIASLVPVLAEEMALASNLAIAEGDDGLVLLARHDESARLVLSPLGVPTWSQNRVPLGLAVETFEDGKLDTPQRLDVRASVPTTAHVDWFSPGSFVELTEAEAMALPAFERHQAGVVVSLDVTRSAGVPTDVSFEEIRLPSTPPRVVDGFVIPAHVLDRMEAVAAPVSIRPRPARFEVLDDRFRVEAGPGTVLATDVSAVAAHLAGRDGRGSSQHVADRLVAVTV
jgi:hypothetical protein